MVRRRKRPIFAGTTVLAFRISIKATPGRLDRTRHNSVSNIMRISARNQIKGTVVEVKKGATTSHVRVDIGGGQIITSSITNEAVDDLSIKAKGNVTVVIKASDVMIAVD
jgi:molybdopterin-binding protein